MPGSLLKFLMIALVPVLFLGSCTNRSIMFKTKRNYQYADFDSILPNKEYRIGINDNIQVRITPNKGAALFDNVGAGSNQGNAANSAIGSTIFSTVEFDGTVKMPLLGRVYVKDLTFRECELLFEERLKLYIVDPYIRVESTNKRVILFPGTGGAARVITLANRNTNLLEAIALTGGLGPTARSNRIKLIRGDLKNPQVFLIDLSTIDEMKKADLILQGNDIIYVEPRNDLVINFMARITPYLAVFNLGLLVYTLVPK